MYILLYYIYTFISVYPLIGTEFPFEENRTVRGPTFVQHCPVMMDVIHKVSTLRPTFPLYSLYMHIHF